jgi:hypothetical protein
MYIMYTYIHTSILSRSRVVTVEGVWIGELDLLTPYTHHSELQAITAPSVISTLRDEYYTVFL